MAPGSQSQTNKECYLKHDIVSCGVYYKYINDSYWCLYLGVRYLPVENLNVARAKVSTLSYDSFAP
jgi:hypothetical protein